MHIHTHTHIPMYYNDRDYYVYEMKKKKKRLEFFQLLFAPSHHQVHSTKHLNEDRYIFVWQDTQQFFFFFFYMH